MTHSVKKAPQPPAHHSHSHSQGEAEEEGAERMVSQIYHRSTEQIEQCGLGSYEVLYSTVLYWNIII
jgi:hypothetical protein